MGLWSALTGAATATMEIVSPAYARERLALQRERDLAARETRFLNQAYEQLSDHFGGVDTTDRQRKNTWLKSEINTNTALENELVDLRINADELYRRSPYIAGAIEHRVSNVVGYGLTPEPRLENIPGYDDEQLEVWESELRDLWNEWSQTCGPGGRVSWTQTLKILLREWKRSGDAFVVWSDDGDKETLSLRLSVISASRCETPTGDGWSEKVRLGVELDEQGNVRNYHFRRREPGDRYDDWKFESIPADRVGHLMDEKYPNQRRGLPWCFAIMAEAKDRDDYRNATVFAAKIHACQTMIVRTDSPHKAAEKNPVKMKPGNIMYVGHKDDVQAFNPSQPTSGYPAFDDNALTSMSAGMAYPRGWFTRDRRKASFSSGKLEEIEGGLELVADFQLLNPIVIRPTYRQFVDRAVMSGKTSIPLPVFLSHRRRFYVYDIAPPSRPYIEPHKEVPADILLVQHNLDTNENVTRRRGKNSQDIARKRVRERKFERENDIDTPIHQGKMPEDEPEPVGSENT